MNESVHSSDAAPHLSDAQRLGSDYWMSRRDGLFLASRIALIVTAMSFAIRGDAMADMSRQFHLTNEQAGWVNLMAFWGFTLAMLIGGPLCDVLGMKRIVWFAVIGHAIGIIATILSTSFWPLVVSTLIFGLANGFVEAACNPLIATLYPDQKIKRLSLFHMWFPGGIVIGGLVAYGITAAHIGGIASWQIKFATMLVPLAIYAALFAGKQLPATERVASGVSTGDMFKECMRPLFLLFVVCMLMTAITELGPQQWFPNILTQTTGIQGILFLIWITGLMAVGRGFAGPVAHKLSPVGMLIGSSILSAIGLYLISIANSAALAFPAATVFALGVCFFWPTMLGVVSERFPKTGALGLAVMGGAGMLASGLIQPIIGHTYDAVSAAAAAQFGGMQGGTPPPQALAEGGRAALQQVVVLPIILTVVFAAIYFNDRKRGGYREEVLVQHQEEGEAAPGNSTASVLTA